VVVLGAGGHARVLLGLLSMTGRPVLGLLDDAPAKRGEALGGHVIAGPLDEVLGYKTDEVELVNAIGSSGRPDMRQAVYDRYVVQGYRFATLVHPSAVIAVDATLGAGVQVMALAVVQVGAVLGADVLLNTRASVDHDSRVGEHCHVAPGATVCGDVTLGPVSHIGAGATVVQGIRLGAGCLVAAGATVIRDVPEGTAVCGVPAVPMKTF